MWNISFQNTICNFVEKCNAYNVLCKVELSNIYIFVYVYVLSRIKFY